MGLYHMGSRTNLADSSNPAELMHDELRLACGLRTGLNAAAICTLSCPLNAPRPGFRADPAITYRASHRQAQHGNRSSSRHSADALVSRSRSIGEASFTYAALRMFVYPDN